MLTLLLLVANAWAVGGSDRIVIENVIGPKEVKVVRRGKEELSYKAGAELFVGDEIRTIAKQVVQLKAFDGSQWKVAPESTLRLDSRKPGKKNFYYWVFELPKGSFWGKVEKEPADDDFRLKVKTTIGSMGVRGTEYLMQYTIKGGMEIDVLEGVVLLSKNPGFELGTYISIKKGQYGALLDGGNFIGPKLTELKTEELLKKYRLALQDEKIPTTTLAGVKAQECLRAQKGWRSFDGGSLGECI